MRDVATVPITAPTPSPRNYYIFQVVLKTIIKNLPPMHAEVEEEPLKGGSVLPAIHYHNSMYTMYTSYAYSVHDHVCL